MKNNNITILYVEDEDNARELLSGFIKRFCETFYVASNGEEGLEIYKKHDIDIVISDIKMPKMDGLDMVDAMKKIDSNQLVIFTTAHIDSEYLFKAIELQVDGYVSKPVDLEKLKARIDKCMIEIQAKDALEKLKSLATIDTLTGIKNRYSINQEIDSEIKRLRRYGGSFSLMMLDIDFFKKVNDTYGHDVGDYVLKEFSDIVSKSIRDTDIFGRWGGEEFILLAPNEELDGAKKLAQKIRKDIENYEFETVKHITVSIGMTVCNSYCEKEKLLKTIDEALYEAKKQGRNMLIYHECSC